ncbi:hypothetical protein BDN67DRAFT_1006045 [Paxillus ammoniavirescens]|nr:hypothetical protein BDN67DRAFT_1006045 [Paxillus ammoniavirescens]
MACQIWFTSDDNFRGQTCTHLVQVHLPFTWIIEGRASFHLRPAPEISIGSDVGHEDVELLNVLGVEAYIPMLIPLLPSVCWASGTNVAMKRPRVSLRVKQTPTICVYGRFAPFWNPAMELGGYIIFERLLGKHGQIIIFQLSTSQLTTAMFPSADSVQPPSALEPPTLTGALHPAACVKKSAASLSLRH